ncbi:MAG: LysR family transcriptional regulator [Gammaproteobacteria bacterium]|nr:LysR family transcriptional regulator [Gammaproteobacteria bacterium]
MSLNPHHLRAFHAVASHGSFSRAASVLHVSQPTLSGQVKALEQRFGVKLFQRRRHGIELTALGRQLHRQTAAMADAEQEIGLLLERETREVAGKLDIGADAPYQIMPIIAALKARHPAVTVSIRFGNSRWLLEALRQGLVDVIIAPNLATRHDFTPGPGPGFPAGVREPRAPMAIPAQHRAGGPSGADGDSS